MCEWRWDTNIYPSTSLKHEDREVLFHPDYSCGTAAARGERQLANSGEHFWEVKMTSAVYGTDMVGLSTGYVLHGRMPYRRHYTYIRHYITYTYRRHMGINFIVESTASLNTRIKYN